MNLRAVITSLAAIGLLSSIAPLGAQAQDHQRGPHGGDRFAQGEGGRGREGGHNFQGFGQPPGGGRGGYGGYGFGPAGPGAGGRQGYGGGWPGGRFGQDGDGRGGYPPAYGGRGDAPAYATRLYPPAYPAAPGGGYGGYGRAFGGGDWRNQQNEVRQAVRDGRHIPLGRAIDAVRQRSPGRELDAGLEPGPDGRTMYRVRWAASNGRRIDYLVDAATGAIVSTQGGR